MNPEQVLRTGGIDQDLRLALTDRLKRSVVSRRKRELLRHSWFNAAQQLTLEGCTPAIVLAGLEELMRLLDAATSVDEDGDVRFGFSPGPECKALILGHLETARRDLDICVFTISDDVIADMIIDRHRSGLSVRVISDNDKARDMGSDVARITEAGIPVRLDLTANHMHHKFSIAGGKELLTGSYNWTRSAERYNQENLLITTSMQAVNGYRLEFERLWHDTRN
jgi:cardiolipin hydrolase